jgi:hypothetical protein
MIAQAVDQLRAELRAEFVNQLRTELAAQSDQFQSQGARLRSELEAIIAAKKARSRKAPLLQLPAPNGNDARSQ